jgi:hypothetical protein
MILTASLVEKAVGNHRGVQSCSRRIDRFVHFETGPTHILQTQPLQFFLIHWCWLSSVSVADPIAKLLITV